MRESFELLLFLSKENLKLSLFDKGEIYAEAAMKLDSENIYAKSLLSYAYLLNEKHQDALNLLEDVTEDFKNVHYVRARSSILSGDIEASHSHWHSYIKVRHNAVDQ